jgi:hypothetical protein
MRNLPLREYLQTPQFIDRIYPVGSIWKQIETGRAGTAGNGKKFEQIGITIKH